MVKDENSKNKVILGTRLNIVRGSQGTVSLIPTNPHNMQRRLPGIFLRTALSSATARISHPAVILTKTKTIKKLSTTKLTVKKLKAKKKYYVRVRTLDVGLTVTFAALEISVFTVKPFTAVSSAAFAESTTAWVAAWSSFTLRAFVSADWNAFQLSSV